MDDSVDTNQNMIDRRLETQIQCSSDDAPILRSISRDDENGSANTLQDSALVEQHGTNRRDTMAQLRDGGQPGTSTTAGASTGVKYRQIRNFTLRVSLDRFCNAHGSDYIPEWERDEHLINVVMPILREYFSNVIEEKLRFIDGCFQLEASNRENVDGIHRNVHIQGCFRVTRKITLNGMRRHFNTNFNNKAPFMIFRGAEVSPVVQSSFEACMQYCRKSKTQIGGPWFFGKSSKYRGRDIIPRNKLWKWQQQLVNLIVRSTSRARHGIFDNRRVLFFVDELGGSGKSSVAKYLDYYGLAAVYNYLTLKDALYLISKDKPRSCYVFDLSRSRPNDVTFEEIACTIESLKNGTVISTKYVPRKRLQHPSMIIVFSNKYPTASQLKMLSRDRWQIIRLTERHIPKDIRRRRRLNRNRELQEASLFDDECQYNSHSHSEEEDKEEINDYTAAQDDLLDRLLQSLNPDCPDESKDDALMTPVKRETSENKTGPSDDHRLGNYGLNNQQPTDETKDVARSGEPVQVHAMGRIGDVELHPSVKQNAADVVLKPATQLYQDSVSGHLECANRLQTQEPQGDTRAQVQANLDDCQVSVTTMQNEGAENQHALSISKQVAVSNARLHDANDQQGRTRSCKDNGVCRASERVIDTTDNIMHASGDAGMVQTSEEKPNACGTINHLPGGSTAPQEDGCKASLVGSSSSRSDKQLPTCLNTKQQVASLPCSSMTNKELIRSLSSFAASVDTIICRYDESLPSQEGGMDTESQRGTNASGLQKTEQVHAAGFTRRLTVPVPDLPMNPTKPVVNVPPKQRQRTNVPRRCDEHHQDYVAAKGEDLLIDPTERPCASMDHTVEQKQQPERDGTICKDNAVVNSGKHINSCSRKQDCSQDNPCVLGEHRSPRSDCLDTSAEMDDDEMIACSQNSSRSSSKVRKNCTTILCTKNKKRKMQ